MDYKVFIPVLISFVLSVILGPLVIPVLRRLKMDQTEREDGVQSHLKKAGTPTMGGVMILLASHYDEDIRTLCEDVYLVRDHHVTKKEKEKTK